MTADVVLDEQLCFPLYATHRAFTRVYARLLGPLGLTYPQYLVLMLLWEHERLTVGELGTLLGLDSGTLTPLLKRLEQNVLVTRARDPEDERRVVVGLSAEGRALQSHAGRISQEVRRASGLGEAQIEALRDLLDRTLASLTTYEKEVEAL